MTATVEFPFRFTGTYRLAALAVGVTPWTAWVRVAGPVDSGELQVRFGAWSLRTALTNIESTQVTGGFRFLRTAGPPRLSFADRGVTFATNADRALCLLFREPVRAIDPTGLTGLRHPGATVTVADPEGLADTIGVAPTA